MDGFAIAYSLSGAVRVRQEGSCFLVESFRYPNRWHRVAGIFDREKAISFMEFWSGPLRRPNVEAC